jgi:hypothetical protein
MQKTQASLLLGRRIHSAVAQQRKLLDCCLRIRCRGNVFTESLPSNERLFWLRYSGFRYQLSTPLSKAYANKTTLV